MQCQLCQHYIYDCVDSALPALSPKRPARIRPLIKLTVTEYARVFAICMKHPTVYEQIRDNLRQIIEFYGPKETEEGLTKCVPILGNSLEFLAARVADTLSLQESDVLAWFRTFSLRLFMDHLDVHKMHTKVIPFQDPTPKKKEKGETVADREAAEALEEPDPLYS